MRECSSDFRGGVTAGVKRIQRKKPGARVPPPQPPPPVAGREIREKNMARARAAAAAACVPAPQSTTRGVG